MWQTHLFTPKIQLMFEIGLLRTHSLLSLYDCYCSKNIINHGKYIHDWVKKISLFEVLTMHFLQKIKNNMSF